MKILKQKIDPSFFLLGIIVLIIIIGVFVAVYTLRSNPVEDALAANRVINVLFVIEDEKKPLSSYVLMYYHGTRRAALFDVPGDIGLLIARNNRVDRIDSVYDSARIGNFQNEIEKLLGIEINFSLVVTRENLVSLVDLLEGVEIFIPSQVIHREGDSLIMFPSGVTVLDGDKASAYAAYSLPEEDREILIARRQRFFTGLLSRWIYKNESLKNRDTAKLYHSYVNTSMNQHTFLRLFEEFNNIDIERTSIQTVGGNLREVSGQNLIIPYWDGNLVKEIVRQTLGTLTRHSEEMGQRVPTVEVLNGTAITGRATRTADMLRSFGYDIISVGNAERSNYESTIIIHRSGDEAMVRAFADIIRCANIRQEYEFEEPEDPADILSREFKADITLIIGRDFDGRFVTRN